jgi:hypothetical protein
MGVGLSVAPLKTALVVHAVAAPLIFCMLEATYFKSLLYASPACAAAVWVTIVILLDFFVVALLIERNLAMFGSPLGTWVPFALIFLVTVTVGGSSPARCSVAEGGELAVRGRASTSVCMACSGPGDGAVARLASAALLVLGHDPSQEYCEEHQQQPAERRRRRRRLGR